METKANPLNISQRIFEVRKHFNLSKEAFGTFAGVSGTSIGNIESGATKNPGADLLGAIATNLGVNPTWLLTGQGLMLTSDAQAQKLSPYNPAEPNVAALGTLADQPHVDLPFLDHKALAHFGQHPGLSLKDFATSPTLRLYLTPEQLPEHYVGAIVVEIFGDSMEPDLHSGERMVVWHIPDSKWEQLHNTVCVVSYEDTVTIKAIAENDLFVYDRLTLRAANPPSSYFVVAREKINSVWEVREYYDRPKFKPGFIRR